MLSLVLVPLVLAAVPFPVPTEVTIEGAARAACTSTSEVRVCKCLSPTPDAPDVFVVERPDERRLSWAADHDRGEVTSFRVASSDLDLDGRPELLVTSRISESDGMTIRSWAVTIVDGAEDVATHFVAHDVPAELVQGTTVLVTEWAWLPVGKPQEPAFFFVGREYHYRRGALIPSKAPVLRRRYTAAFEEERQAALKASQDLSLPARQFLANPSTERGSDELPRHLRPVTLRAITRDEPEYELHGEDASGNLLTFSSDGEEGLLLRLGDASAKRLFPLRYWAHGVELVLGRSGQAELKDDRPTGILFLPVR